MGVVEMIYFAIIFTFVMVTMALAGMWAFNRAWERTQYRIQTLEEKINQPPPQLPTFTAENIEDATAILNDMIWDAETEIERRKAELARTLRALEAIRLARTTRRPGGRRPQV